MWWRGRSSEQAFLSMPCRIRRVERKVFHRPRLDEPSEAEYADHMVNMEQLSGAHLWETAPTRKPNINAFTQGAYRRPDMQRVATMFGRLGSARTTANWRDMIHNHWFQVRIPASIPSERTFARDELEVQYVDAMDHFLGRVLAGSEPVDLRTLPLLAIGDALLGRWWQKFYLQRIFAFEADWRLRYGMFVPMTVEDIPFEHDNLDLFAQLYPPTPFWFKALYFPAGVPAPTPLCVYYWHTKMRRALALGSPPSRAREVWDQVLAFEWALLYTAAWWHEAARGGRAFVLPDKTIEWLRNTIGDVPLDPDTQHGEFYQTSTAYVFDAMDAAACCDGYFYNQLRFEDTSLPVSFFVHCTNSNATLNLHMRSDGSYERSVGSMGRLQNRKAPRDKQGFKQRWNRARDVDFNLHVDESDARMNRAHPAGEERPQQRRRFHNTPHEPPPRAAVQYDGQARCGSPPRAQPHHGPPPRFSEHAGPPRQAPPHPGPPHPEPPPCGPRFMVHRGTVCLRNIHTLCLHLHAIHRRGGSCSRIESLRHRRRRSRAAHRVAIRSTIQTTRSSACRTTGAQIGGWK